ncbi:MAG: hypothetical protein ACYCZW_01640 [Minisyncoccota bacterium]
MYYKLLYSVGMKGRNTIGIIVTLIIILTVGWILRPVWSPYFYFLHRVSPNDVEVVASTTPVTQWENTKYHYSISVPVGTSIDSIEHRVNPEEQPELEFRTKDGYVLITIFDFSFLKNLSPENRVTYEKAKKISEYDLKSFAAHDRNIFVNDVNPYIKNIKISELKEVQFDGKKAFEFTIDKTYDNGTENNLVEVPHAHIITETPQGYKMIINYKLNTISRQMVESIKFY